MLLDFDKQPLGVHLADAQGFDGAENQEWHLHQDLAIALGLFREEDKWLCPREGYAEIARLTRSGSDSPSYWRFDQSTYETISLLAKWHCES